MKVCSTNSELLSAIYRKIIKKQIVLPIWQRESVWGKSQKQEWFKTIDEANKNTGNISGMITTFLLSEDEGQSSAIPHSLNDGAQRIFHNLPEYVNYLKNKGIDHDSVLDNVRIAVQHVIYDNIEEATKEFYRINALGTSATPYELAQSIFARVLEKYGNWKGQLFEISEIVKNALTSLGCKHPTKPAKEHARIRDSFAMFLRFIRPDYKKEIKVSNKHVNPSSFKEDINLEESLSEEMNKLGFQEIDKKIILFKKNINEISAFISDLIKEAEWKQSIAPNEVLMRWLFNFYIFSYNNYSLESIKKFILNLLKDNGNKSRIVYKNDQNEDKLIILSTQRIHSADLLGKLYGNLEKKKSKEKNNLELKPGYTHSHIIAESNNGTQTVIENAISNRARGNRDMEEDEIRILSK
jgi:hypothetical protein